MIEASAMPHGQHDGRLDHVRPAPSAGGRPANVGDHADAGTVQRPFTARTPRVVAARRLLRRRDRDERRRFLAEGPQAVREALASPGAAQELFGTADGLARHTELTDLAESTGVPVSVVTDEALAALAETVTPQGVVAVCGQLDVSLQAALAAGPRLVTLLADVRDPGNAGTILRTADAAGAEAVVFAGDAVDPYNGKCVRASAGSLFHVPLVRDRDAVGVVAAARAAGLTVLAATGYGDTDLHGFAAAGGLAGPIAWLFGSEAHGLPPDLLAAADARVRVPLYGRAESLNLAAAAAVCLYTAARAHHEESPS